VLLSRQSFALAGTRQPKQSSYTITTFTCQATVRKNEAACSDVIAPFGLHAWKWFTCGRRVG